MKLLLLALLSLNLVKVPHKSVGDLDFVSVSAIKKKFGFPALRAKSGLGFVAYGHKVWVYPAESTYSVDRKDFPTDEIFIDSTGVYLSAQVWADILTRVTPSTYYWDAEKHWFIVSKYPPSIKRVKLEELGDTVIFTVKYNGDLRTELKKEGNVLRLTVVRGYFRGRWKYRDSLGYLKLIRVFHTLRGATFEIKMEEGVDWWKRERRGVTRLYFRRKESTSESTPSGKEKSNAIEGTTDLERKIDLIVIDPGHGGRDPGAIGPTGKKEKDITLAIAKKLKRILERKLRVKVVLTRDRDVFVPLLERAKIANRLGADLFISIHCNSGRNRHASGVETYFLSEARTEWERAVAAYENSAIKYELEDKLDTTDILKYILMDMAQTEFLKESQDLALFIQQSLAKATKKVDRGVKQAGFYVLFGAYMPAVLVEVGFLSNKKEERLLSSRKYQEKIAYGIYRGIKKFKEKYERGG